MPTVVETPEAAGHITRAARVARVYAGARIRARVAAGFTMIEMVVLLAIMAIILALAIPSFTGSRSAGNARIVYTAAVEYRDAIAAYQTEHGNRVPRIGDADWQATPLAALQNGPLDMQGKRYMKAGRPEQVIDGSVTFGGPDVSRGKLGRIIYEESGSTHFRITVEALTRPNTWTITCIMSNEPGLSDRCS